MGLTLAEAIRARFADDDKPLIDRLVQIANDNHRDRVPALMCLLERGYGKPPQDLPSPRQPGR